MTPAASTASAPPGPRRRRRLVAIAAFVALFAAACAADDSFEATTMDAGSPDVATAERGVAEPMFDEAVDVDVPAPPGDDMPVPPSDAPTGRHVIRSAYLELEADDTAELLDAIVRAAERAGGYAATTDLARDADGVVTGWLTLRVPSERLDDLVATLEDLADAVPSSRVDEYDVTWEVTDVEARLSNLRAFETELLALLGEVREATPDADELLSVFERIRQTRLEIEQLEARRASLADQVSMSTVNVHITQTPAPPAASDVEWLPVETLREAWAATVRTFAMIGDAAIWLLVTALPVIAVVVVLPVVVIVGLVRRRRRNRPAPPPPPADAAASSPGDGERGSS